MKDLTVVRLYDRTGKHILSILPCGSNDGVNFNCDLATPKGKILYCEDVVYPESGETPGALQTIVDNWPHIELLNP